MNASMSTVPIAVSTTLDSSATSAATQPQSSSRSRTSNLLQNVIHRMRPLPFQYVFSCWATKASISSSPILLAAEIPDIAFFYRVYNNFPWSSVQNKDAVHFFRQGVRPLWEDEANLQGGCWTLRVKKNDPKALRTWEEICLMVCGGELQAFMARERDHVLGVSFSPRLYVVNISVWTKNGTHQSSIDRLQRTILERLSPDLRPGSEAEYYYKKHSEHGGWTEAVQAGKQ